jgi:ABC-type branched-subunit amino acid transport system ATPase component/ABC-type branched-subunit amino acid transport system permease subunit
MTRAFVRHFPLLLFIAAIAASGWLSNYHLSVVTYVMMYAIVCIGLVLMTGVAGMMSFGQAAFAGLGAYITSYLATAHGLSPWLGLLIALAGASCVASLIGTMTVRMGGHYLALATLCFCISLYFLAGNAEHLGRFSGITGIPPLTFFGHEVKSERDNYLIVLIVLAAVAWWVRRLLNSRMGRMLRSLRASPLLAETFGVGAHRYRLVAFVVAAVLAALSGWLYAHVQRFINPTPFGVQTSIEYLFMIVIGGSSEVFGAILGAGIFTLLKQELQVLLAPLFGPTTRLEMLVFAGLMILMLAKARQGLWPTIGAWTRWVTPPPQPVAPVVIRRLRTPPRPSVPLLTATNMRRTFGGLVAVDDVSFDVMAGEIVGLLGPNGAGKSTLFHLITGVLPATSGDIAFLGEPLPAISARDMCRRGTACTFQHAKLVPDMTVIENVALGATHLGRCGLLSATFGLDRDEERRLLGWSMHLLDRVGLANNAYETAGSLPLGHRRVLEVARALAAQPLLLLLDEPAAGLRANEKNRLAALLRSLRDEGLGVLLVEHDVAFMSSVADRLMVMNLGRRIALGTPAEVCSNAAVQQAYLGAAA